MKRRVAIKSATTVALMILRVSLAQSSQSQEHWGAALAATAASVTPGVAA